jgi:hypothetical protein
VNRRTLLCGLAVLLGGCAGESSDPESPTPTETRSPTETRTPTLRTLTGTPTPSPTETPTPTETPAPTPTPTASPTPTPTATPTPAEVVVGRGSWATVETGGTELGVRVTDYLVRDDLPGVGTPAEDEQWVDVRTQVRNTGETALTLSWRQWALVDVAGTRHGPASKAMKNADDAMPREWTLDPLDGRRSRVIFATENPRGGEVLAEPYRNAGGPTVRIVPG